MRDVVEFRDRLELRLTELSGREDVTANGALDYDLMREIDAVSAALDRIRSGAFGVCMICGNDVPETRLASNPTAALCNNCAHG